MSYTAEELVKIAVNYEQLAAKSLVVSAKKQEKKKLDPKAKVRNRGTVCVPAEQAKDKKDHFPINDEGQARNALARVQQLSSAPWYKGSLEGLKALVSRKVHSKYPGIGKDKKSKKSSEYYDALLNKYGQTTTWNQTEQSDEDAKNFMANPTPAAPVDKTYSPTPQKLDTDFVTNLQKFLLSKKYNLGPTGADGKMGRFTSQALKTWQQSVGLTPSGQTDEATMKALTPLMQAQGLLPKTDAPGAKFDHRATNEALNAISALLTQYQSQSAQGQITAANVDAISTTLAQYEGRLNQIRGELAAFNVDPNMTPEQAGLLKGLYPKAEKMASDIEAWKKYLAGIKAKGNPAARM